jgi:hypothetical protein
MGRGRIQPSPEAVTELRGRAVADRLLVVVGDWGQREGSEVNQEDSCREMAGPDLESAI